MSDAIPEFMSKNVNLASPRLGSQAILCSDDFFASKERMLQDAPAIFIDDKFDDHGKWMDGWESRRRRDSGNDWCLVKLGVTGHIHGADIDTSHFTGNYPPAASLKACLSDTQPDENTEWTEILAPLSLGPSAHHYAEISNSGPWNWIKLDILPDGGVARLRLYGQPTLDWSAMDTSKSYELSALKYGGRVVAYNDAHYGDVWAVLSEGRGLNMGDGWETRRRREPGNDWIIVALGAPGSVNSIEVDTAHFKGNFPDKCSIQAANIESATDASLITQSMFWETLMDEQKLSADTIHNFESDIINNLGKITHVRLNIHPDGGVSRLRIFGKPQL